MSEFDDDLDWADEAQSSGEPWKIVIVDDEPEVHEVTQLVLASFRFEERPLQFLHAYSGDEGRQLLVDHPDTAVVLLDVVMETEQAGLELVKVIRGELANRFVRIVLRTGQPGQAPEQDVIRNYDINDYKEKTELTSQRLFTTLYATLRAYRDIMIIEENKRGLERVIESSAHIFSHQESHQFASAVLNQITNLVGVDRGTLYCKINRRSEEQPEHFYVAAATGPYQRFVKQAADERLPEHIAQSLRDAFDQRASLFLSDHYVLHFTDSHATESLLYVAETYNLAPLDLKLLEVFCTNVSIAFENLHLHQEIADAQMEMLCLLAGAAETRSQETANHVRRVGLLAELFALKLGLPVEQASMLRLAAPLHDIGKIGIPDNILNKPGPHTEEERTLMQRHAEIGARLLGESRRPLLKMAAQVALDHHENWDGSGYPRGLKGEDISIVGRITALADVFDALGSRRCYKEPWPDEQIQDFIREQRGRKFDPDLVDVMFEHWHEVEAVRAKLPDRSGESFRL